MGEFRRFRKSSATKREHHGDQHRFEHWYLDNQVYFITARCRGRYPAFATDAAKNVFWDRFDHYTTISALRRGSPACSTTTITRLVI